MNAVPEVPPVVHANADLYLACGTQCVGATFDPPGHGFAPTHDALTAVHATVMGLARALGMICDGADDDADSYEMRQAVGGIADAIVLHVGLAASIDRELQRTATTTLRRPGQ